MKPVGASGLTIFGASAGTGKTHRVTEEIKRALSSTGPDAVPVDGLLAVTYTRQAQVELESRIRRKLFEAGLAERAQQLPLAYVGTVHAVCLRWLQEHALDAGHSPSLRVLADERGALAQALEEAVPQEHRDELDDLAERLEPHVDHREGQTHWEWPVAHIITLARHGRIRADELDGMARRSFEGLRALLPMPMKDAAPLDRAFAEVLDSTCAALVRRSFSLPEGSRSKLEDIARRVSHDPLPWSAWVAVEGLKCSKAAEPYIDPLREAAAAHRSHPLFHHDLERFTHLVYKAAALTLRHYETWKRERHLVDYVDMVDQALTLLDDEPIAQELSARLKLCVVDELQDSSPIQLALFLRLHRLAGRSYWVGDPKQCIFEYAGADPTLMDAVVGWARENGGAVTPLSVNHRTLPPLLDLTNTLFTSTLASHGIAPEEVRVTPREGAPAEPAGPPLRIWYAAAGNKAGYARALAEGIARLLGEGERPLVYDRVTADKRALRPGDVAVLVATNDEAHELADALARLGHRAAVARSGLLQTPEGVALGAALRYVLDEQDRLSLAELEALHGWDGLGPDAWLDRELAPPEEGRERTAPPWRHRLDALRDVAAIATPAELVEAAFVALDLPLLCARWPDPPQRLTNLDALRRFAGVYERRCAEQGEGASLAGLLRFLQGLQRTFYEDREAKQGDEQHAGSDDGAVTLTTYHRAKGLEWPVVILSSLDKTARDGEVFEVAPETDAHSLDPEDPLAGRWIRYWPWPYGRNGDPALEGNALASAAGTRLTERKRRERARLLYVGFTRPRDVLILATHLKKGTLQVSWLRELSDREGRPALVLPPPVDRDTKVTLRVGSAGTGQLEVEALAWSLTAGDEAAPIQKNGPRTWFSRGEALSAPPYRIKPSAADASAPFPALQLAALHRLHDPLPLETAAAVEWSDLGDAVHAFLACDLPGLSRDARLERAGRLLTGHGARGALAPESLLLASESFSAFVEQQLPGARWRREIPIEVRLGTEHGERLIDGRIDLLLETDDRLVIVDHKSFPGASDAALRAKAGELAPQLAAYAHALAIARPGRRIDCWLHFVTAGAVVELSSAAR